MPSGETLTDQNGTPMGTNTNPMFATFVDTESGDKVKTSGTTLTGIDGNVQGTTANPLIVKIQDGTIPVDPNPMKVSGTTLTDTFGEPIGTNANPLILKAVGGGVGKQIKTGTFTPNSNTIATTYYSGSVSGNWNYIQIPTTFKPSTIVVTRLGGTPITTMYQANVGGGYTELVTLSYQSQNSSTAGTYAFRANVNGIVVNSSGFTLPTWDSSTVFYIAYE